jgi:plastocyanin
MQIQLLSGALLVGAAALAATATRDTPAAQGQQLPQVQKVPQAQKADCCSTKSAAEFALSATPYLQPIAGPAATGRVVFTDALGGAGGKTVLEGDKPEKKPLDIDAEKSKGCMPEGQAMDMTDQSLLVDDKGGVANVVLVVSVKDAKVTVPAEPFKLDQSHCHYEPHVAVVPVGTTIEYHNSDKVSHNVHTYPKKNDPKNPTIPAGAKESQKLEKVDEIAIKCDIHPWMSSYVIVTDTPFYAVSGPDGSFSIAGLPEGTHKVEWWHEKLGKGKADLVVKADGTSEPLTISLGAKEKKPRR